MNGFKQWLDETFSEDNGKGSVKRTCGFLGFLCSQIAFLYAEWRMVEVKDWTACRGLWDANALLVGAVLGITAATALANKMKNGDTAQAAPPA